MRFNFFVFFILSLLSTFSNAQIRFNEACSSNKNVLDDEDGNSSDWIELYNDGFIGQNLSGHYLTDSRKDTTKWQFGNVTIASGGFLVVFASDKNRPNGAEPHTNFKLSSGGETIWLYNSNKELIDSLTLPFLTQDVSFGSSQDGNFTRVFFEAPTPGASNNGSVFTDHIVAYAPTFSHGTGIFSNAFELTISTKDIGATIRYTLDGSQPDGSSLTYTEPIEIAENAVVSAKVFKTGLLESKTVVGNFIFRKEQTLPIVSLSTHPGYFFDPDTGIYEPGPNASPEFPHHGANYWSDTEIPVNVQWIDTYGRIGFDQVMGVRIHGGSVSRTRPMRSLRLLADDEYGKDEVEYSLFENKTQPTNKRFILRNSGSDYMKTMFRDGFLANVFIENQLHVDAASCRPVEVYLNGDFWGIHNVREKVDRYYLNRNHGVDDDNLDILEEEDQIMEGDFVTFEAMESQVLALDASEDAEFAIADSLFDVKNMADYIICQTYTNNWDWPYNNLKYWRERKVGAKWRYIIFDLDVTFDGVSFIPADADAIGRALGEYGADNRHMTLFKKLLENRTYFEYFINRHCDLVNTVFSKSAITKAAVRAADTIEPIVPRHFERWNTELDMWYEEVEKVKDYAAIRPFYATKHLQDFLELGEQSELHLNVFPPQAGNIELNSITLREFPFEGIYFDDVPINVSVKENQGFRFSHWESNRTELNPASKEHSFLPSNRDSLTAVFVGNSTFSKLDIYPNPANSAVSIQFVNGKKGRVSVYLNSVDGRTQRQLLNRVLQSGSHKLNMNLPSSLQGMFFITVTTETDSFSEKLVLVKKN